MNLPSKPARTQVKIGNAPAAIAEYVIWLVWRYEWNGRKWTKVPYRAEAPSRKASSTDPKTWSSVDEAYSAYENNEALDGIGFVLGDDLVGADLDDCLDGEELHAAAQEVVDRLVSYTEWSPSGTGLHTVMLGEYTGPHKVAPTPWGGEFEIYGDGRYFTFTGDVFDGTPRKVTRSKGVEAIVRELKGFAGDEKIIDRLRQSTDTFGRLFDEGDYGMFESHSEADTACAACSPNTRATRRRSSDCSGVVRSWTMTSASVARTTCLARLRRRSKAWSSNSSTLSTRTRTKTQRLHRFPTTRGMCCLSPLRSS